jgi:malate synthase
MTTPLMSAYVDRLIYICHKRGTFAMGGMSASIPIKDDPVKNAAAMQKVQADKIREVQAGHDGTWVAHPALVKVAKDVFDQYMKTSNQIDSAPRYCGARITEADLLQLPTDIPPQIAITSQGLAHGIGILLAYTEAWLRGVGCIPLHNAMEDAATAEISRAQIWQWRHLSATTADDGGQPITAKRIAQVIEQQVSGKQGQGKWTLAAQLVERMLNGDSLDEFLTLVCYPHIVQNAGGSKL